MITLSGLLLAAIGFGGMVASYRTEFDVSFGGDTQRSRMIGLHWILLTFVGIVVMVIGGIL